MLSLPLVGVHVTSGASIRRWRNIPIALKIPPGRGFERYGVLDSYHWQGSGRLRLEIDENFRPYLKTYPATELVPYAEPVSPQEMQEGRVYFVLQFLDRDFLVPHLYPLIFLGLDLDGDSRNLRYFQDFDSYMAGVRYGGHGEEDSSCFHVYGPEEGKHIFDYEYALKGLMRCALTRRDMVDIDQRIRRLAKDAQSGESQP